MVYKKGYHYIFRYIVCIQEKYKYYIWFNINRKIEFLAKLNQLANFITQVLANLYNHLLAQVIDF